MKVLYCIALLLIGWSSARTEKLDESRLMAFCGERNVAYVKAKVAKFGEKAVLAAKSLGNHCLLHAIVYGREWCRQAKEKCWQEQAELVKYLLDLGADANEKLNEDYGGYSAIAEATYSGNIPVMKMLLDHGADIEIPNEYGVTPIIRGARGTITNNTSALSLLIKKGANINAADKEGKTALIYVTRSGNIPAMKLLLDSGADTEIGDTLGQTPIFYINGPEYEHGHTQEALSLLIKNGANIDAKDMYGETALSYAAQSVNIPEIKLLLDLGADPALMNGCIFPAAGGIPDYLVCGPAEAAGEDYGEAGETEHEGSNINSGININIKINNPTSE